MPKNIVIFSDGTGNRAGVYADENRTNIYKLYRATRCAPDSSIKSSEQLAFYDPGVGTSPPDAGALRIVYNAVVDIVGKLTGLGLTRNLVDCYAALIDLWEPGDRIYLFGFSRGAYTVRLLGGVIGLCGVPTSPAGSNRFKRDSATIRAIAEEAVTRVYQHTYSVPEDQRIGRQAVLLDQRDALARAFRARYGSETDSNKTLSSGEMATRDRTPNAAPHFIGVFDTVSSLEIQSVMLALAAVWGVFLAVVSCILGVLTPVAFAAWFWFFGFLSVLYFGAWALQSRLKAPGTIVVDEQTGQNYPWWNTIRLTFNPMKFNNYELGRGVKVARHALSIDERRKTFVAVPWVLASKGDTTADGGMARVEQKWFAGVHSDVGGGYPENSARLSDIALEWMVAEAAKSGLKIDGRFLELSPDPAGPQHDEAKDSPFFKWFPKKNRRIPETALLHCSVKERFRADAVLNYDVFEAYRPVALRDHPAVKEYYR